jgi:hypothetical protein
MRIKENLSRMYVMKEVFTDDEGMSFEECENLLEKGSSCVFATSKAEALSLGGEDVPLLKGDPASLATSNIEGIMGGRVRIWNGGRKSTGLKTSEGKMFKHESFGNPVSHEDSKLEFVT